MIFNSAKLLLIAGPCTLESEAVVIEVAEALNALRNRLEGINLVFKGSFDKANRTSGSSKRGPGIEEGLELLAAVKRRFGIPVTTDIHLPEQAALAAEVCDVLQIPAFLCRQTDLLEAAAATGRCVNVKKGQFLAPSDMKHVVSKLRSAGAAEIWQTERGTTFGYQNLVVDMRSFPIMAANQCPVIMDATHSVQLPGGTDGTTGGDRRFVPTLAAAALAAGADGLFVETHPNPSRAVSDAGSQLPLDQLSGLLEECLQLWSIKHPAR